MRKFYFFILFFSFQFLFNTKSNGQAICKDSSFINSYYLNNRNIRIGDRIPTSDNGTLAFVSTIPNDQQEGIVKFSSGGKMDWDRTFASSDNHEYFKIAKFFELKDGNYIIGGVVQYSDASRSSYLVLIKLDNNGNLIWQKKYRNNYGSSTADVVKINSLNEGSNGDIISLIFQDASPGIKNGRCISRFSANGDVIWSNQYSGYGIFIQNSINVFRNNALHFWGRTYGGTDCDEQLTSLSFIRINYSTGETDTVKKFCTQPGNKNIKFFITDNGNDDVMTKQLANGNTIVFSYFRTVEKDLLISEFDSKMNFLRGKLFSPPDLGSLVKMPNYNFDASYSTGEVVFNSFYEENSFPYKVLPFFFFCIFR